MEREKTEYIREDHLVSTTDGWKIYIKRYKPHKYLPVPVVLCHGVGANGYSLDLYGDEEDDLWKRYSLAYYLLSGGKDKEIKFDVWVPELRGRKASQTFHPVYYPQKYNWNVDTYIDHDVPDIVNYIKQVYYNEGYPDAKLLWVGKSMGGMIAYAYGMTEPGKRFLKGVVTISSPIRFENVGKEWGIIFKAIKKIHPRKKSFPVAWIKILRMIGYEEILKKNICNIENIDEKILQDYIDKGADNTLSLKIFLQFLYFIKLGYFCRYPQHPWLCDLFQKIPILRKLVRPYSYKDHINEFKIPVLMITGGGDKLAPPEEISYVCNHIGTKEEDKECIIFSVTDDTPGTCDYGHLDINYGEKAKEEVYPFIYKWLKERCKEVINEVDFV